jgi:hypothetical protein
MTINEQRDQILAWLAEAKGRSASAYVDDRRDWAAAAVVTLAQHAAGTPVVLERRSGIERRDVDRPDDTRLPHQRRGTVAP